MKKAILAMIAIAAATGILAGCGKTVSSESSAKESVSGSEPASDTPEEEPSEEASEDATEEISEEDATEAVEPQTEKPTAQVDPLGGGAFSYDENGAVTFNGDSAEQSDEVLIAAAQALFNSACRTEWNYTVGCPYERSQTEKITSDFGWEYYKVVTPGITSMDDVRADYYKTFSDRYESALDELYIEQDGALYAMDGSRGKDLYYSCSIITGVKSRSDDEIVFTVENQYTGTDRDPSTPNTVEAEFSAVIESDGTWKVGKFALPY